MCQPTDLITVITGKDALTYGEMKRQPDKPKFITAMQKEIFDHKKRKHMNLVHRSETKGENMILAIWSLRRRKDNIIGKVTKYKARTDGIRAIQVVKQLTLAAIENLHTKSIDFVLAYPHANLDVDIYMWLQEGFNAGPESGRYVLKLQNNLNGLKQVGHNWFRKLYIVLGNLSIKPSKLDTCVFIEDDIIMLVYVD